MSACGAQSPSGARVCTQDAGHDGYHATLGSGGTFVAAWKPDEFEVELGEVVGALSGIFVGALINAYPKPADSDLERCRRVARVLGVAVDHFEHVDDHETAEAIREYAAAVAHAGDAL